MKLADKLAPAKRAVEFIARHDDEPVAEREKVLDALAKHAATELAAARKRAAEKAKAAPKKGKAGEG
jgi:hypothetical protein